MELADASFELTRHCKPHGNSRCLPCMPNLKHSLRTIFKSPFVSAIAILSLALGIGANSAIFSLFDEMLLKPLPVVDPSRLVNFGAPGPNPGSQNCGQAGDCDVVFTYPMFKDLEKANTGFSGIAAHVIFGANVAYDGVTVNGDGMQVSGSYFPVLGLKPTLGRLLNVSDDLPLGENFYTVVSHGFWTSQLGSDPQIVGKTMIINGKSMTVIGVGPPGFEGITLGSQPKVFVPLSMRRQLQMTFRNDFEDRQSYYLYLFGRLKPGVSMAQAKATINGVYTPIL